MGWRGRIIPRFRPYKQFPRYDNSRFKKQYLNQTKTKLPEFIMPQELIDRGVQLEYGESQDFLKSPLSSLPGLVSSHPLLKTHDPIQNHMDYKPDQCLLFNGKEPFSDGIAQALHMTKCVLREGLPPSLLESIQNVQYPSGDKNYIDHVENLRRIIMRSQKWDGTLEVLPPRKDKVLFWRNFNRVMGISEERKNSLFLEGLYRYCLSFANDLPHLNNLYHQRHMHIHELFKRDGLLHGLDLTCPFFVTCNKKLSPILNVDQVLQTKDEPLSDVYPIDPIIDLTPTNIYKEQSSNIGRVDDYIHTVFTYRMQDFMYPWAQEQNASNAIMHAFAAALMQARKIYGPINGDLPEPIVAQCVHFCQDSLDLAVFQLNTLDLDDIDGIRNVAWIDKENRMYKYVPHWEDFPGLDEYFQPKVFDKFFGMIAN